MAKRNRTAIGVHMRGVIGNSQIAQHREPLARKCLVEFYHVEIGRLDAEACAQFAGGRCRTKTHDARCETGSCSTQNAGDGREAMALRSVCRGDD